MELSVFFPCHNEAENIGPLLAETFACLPALVPDFEVIVVDDGSTDGTGGKVTDLARGYGSRLRLVSHPVNRGYGDALKSGFGAARGELVFYTDGDGQYDIREIGRCLEAIKDCEAVTGYRISRRDPFHRRLNGQLWTLLMAAAFGVNVRDVDCAFKLYRRAVLEGMPLLAGGALIDAEMLARVKRRGGRVRQLPVSHRPRRAGRQSGASPTVIIRAFRELLRYYDRINANL